MVQNDHFLINLPRLQEDEMGQKMIKISKILKISKNFQIELGASEKQTRAILELKRLEISHLMPNIFVKNFQKILKKMKI